jgi:bifunctional DNA-binding transcriptional regulator/antitoxin component of YhaV-PrlF toxin-antitoxin module
MTTPIIKFRRKANDNAGSIRLNIPAELVEAFDIKNGDILTIYAEGDKIIIEMTDK